MEIWMNGNLRSFVTNKAKAQGILDYVSYFHVHKEYSKSNSPSVYQKTLRKFTRIRK